MHLNAKNTRYRTRSFQEISPQKPNVKWCKNHTWIVENMYFNTYLRFGEDEWKAPDVIIIYEKRKERLILFICLFSFEGVLSSCKLWTQIFLILCNIHWELIDDSNIYVKYYKAIELIRQPLRIMYFILCVMIYSTTFMISRSWPYPTHPF